MILQIFKILIKQSKMMLVNHNNNNNNNNHNKHKLIQKKYRSHKRKQVVVELNSHI